MISSKVRLLISYPSLAPNQARQSKLPIRVYQPDSFDSICPMTFALGMIPARNDGRYRDLLRNGVLVGIELLMGD